MMQDSQSEPGLADPQALLDEVATELRRKLPLAKVRAPAETAVPDDEISVTIELSMPQREQIDFAPWDSTVRQVAGQLELTIKQANPAVVDRHRARFVDKPWVESLSRFESRQSDGRQWLVARSPKFASSELEARRLAVERAGTLIPAGNRGDTISKAIGSGELVVDRFSQRLSRPYGDVWREAILVDVTPQRLASLTYRETVRAKVVEVEMLSTVTGRLFACILIIVIATILYLVLNAITRGYYPLPVGLMVGALVVLMALAFLLVWVKTRRDHVSGTAAARSLHASMEPLRC